MQSWANAAISALTIRAAVLIAVAVMFIPGEHAKRATPDRITACHKKGGAARLDARGIFIGCLIHPP
jgi:hypothetical protein